MTKIETESQAIDPGQWVDKYGDTLYSYALFRMEDKSLAEELVQETFLAALGSLDSFKGKSSLKTWFFSILKNKISDHLRRKYKESGSSYEDYSENYIDEFFTEKGEWLTYPGRWHEMPQQQFEQQEFFKVLSKCLVQLSPKQRETFTLREFDEITSEKICKVLNITTTNYWVLMHRARLVIRKCLEHNWFSSS